ncbi:sterol desaturase family protein [Glycocaulis sp.]|uniref:sterol desaturase family protein n=1 Tax=Glycocaulis sp. TaxID=1969725 RepID=UPI003F6F5A0E
MSDTILAAEPLLRLAAFAGVLAAMMVWELAAPRRRREIPRLVRWSNNLAVVVLDTAILRLAFPLLAVAFALWAEGAGWGLFNVLGAPLWLALPLSVLLLDLVIYGQHVMLHKVPVLWRFHRMHHADLEFDVTTGLRFHPGEIVLSMIIKLAVVGLLGAPALAVLVFEVLLNATSMFNHSNIRLPCGLDRVLRLFVVTPDMHRVHHSVLRHETDSNYGFNLPWWDRLFGTYRAQPEAGHDAMTIGIGQFREPRDLWLDRMLLQPFRGGTRDPAPAGNKRGAATDG